MRAASVLKLFRRETENKMLSSFVRSALSCDYQEDQKQHRPVPLLPASTSAIPKVITLSDEDLVVKRNSKRTQQSGSKRRKGPKVGKSKPQRSGTSRNRKYQRDDDHSPQKSSSRSSSDCELSMHSKSDDQQQKRSQKSSSRKKYARRPISKYKNEDAFITSTPGSLVRVSLHKPLGIVFESMDGGVGVQISELPKGGAANLCGKLGLCDELISINDTAMSRWIFDDIMNFIIRTTPDEALDMLFCQPQANQKMKDRYDIV